MQNLLEKEFDPNAEQDKIIGLTDEGKEVVKAAKAKKAGGINRDELVLVQLAEGYLFCKKIDGLVRYRSDIQHADVIEGNSFVEPQPRQQSKNSF